MSSQTLNVARPILKSSLASIKSPRPASKQRSLRVPSSPSVVASKVHFPPTPTISVIFETHANELYDRTAIVVSPTSHAIPWSEKNAKFSLGARATMADIFCTPQVEAPSKVESLIKGSSAAVDYSDSEESDSVSEMVKTRSVKFAVQPPVSPIPGKRSKFDLEKALSFLPYPVSPYPRSPSFDPRSPSTDKENLMKPKGFGVNRDTWVPAVRRGEPEKTGNTLAVPKASSATRRRPAQLNLDEIAPPPMVRFAPPGLPVSPVAPPSINSVLDSDSDSDSGSDSDGEGRSLRAAFWRSVKLEKNGSAASSLKSSPTGSVEAQSLVSPALASPFPVFLYKNLKSPALPRKSRANAGDFMGSSMVGFGSCMSPTTLNKNLQGLTSPAVKDPQAGFTSFAAAFGA